MASQLAASEGPASGPIPPMSAPLIGNLGQEYVQNVLSTNDPVTAIADIQARGALADPRCLPLLGLLDQLDVSRADSHRYIVRNAVEIMLQRIPSLPPDRLMHLLEETFQYIGISELRAVPLAVLDRLRPVPVTFLKQLASDRELFWELPSAVQQQAWELDRKLLHAHALPLVTAYTYETATWMEGLNMDGDPISSGKELSAGEKRKWGTNTIGVPHLARQNLRRGSSALRRLVAIVGHSPHIYRSITDLCTARFRDGENYFVGMKDGALCALRSQLLMALHDAGETAICAGEPSHKVAWILDACLKDGSLDSRRIKELGAFFSRFATGQNLSRPPKISAGKAKADRKRPKSARDNDAESAGVPGAAAAASEDPLRDLSAAAMVVRDPAAFHLIIRQIIRRIERCVNEQIVPKEDPEVMFLAQLLTTAVSARDLLRHVLTRYPEVNSEVTGTLFPLIAEFMLDSEIRSVEPNEESKEPEPPPDEMVRLLVRDEVSRRVVQAYGLNRLRVKDYFTARRMLRALSVCLDRISEKAIPEFAPFGFTLARCMATLFAANEVRPGDALWNEAVDGILVRLVDAETEVHEEVLRLLLAAGPQLETPKLAAYLATTLAHSVHSRTAHESRATDAAGLPPAYLDEFSLCDSYFGTDGGTEEWWTEGSGDASGGADGVRGTYALFCKRIPTLSPRTAPELYEYLQQTAE